jgi:ABC-type antimicrobial peptide transport system permease subunit
VREALGASARDIRGMVLQQVGMTTVIGIAAHKKFKLESYVR